MATFIDPDFLVNLNVPACLSIQKMNFDMAGISSRHIINFHNFHCSFFFDICDNDGDEDDDGDDVLVVVGVGAAASVDDDSKGLLNGERIACSGHFPPIAL